MARKPSALAALDIVGEGLAQQDGLAERLSRQRAARASPGAAPPERAPTPGKRGGGKPNEGKLAERAVAENGRAGEPVQVQPVQVQPVQVQPGQVQPGHVQPDQIQRDQIQRGRVRPAEADHNAWRRGKALLQVAIADEAHLELSILAKRRRMTLSQLVKEALNQWLDRHGHALRVPD
jgi:hypothetical protein